MAKLYRVQDLAQYNRVVSFEDGDVNFDGHFANVPEEHLNYFSQSSDFQVIGSGFEEPSSKFAGDTKAKEAEQTEEEPATEAETTEESTEQQAESEAPAEKQTEEKQEEPQESEKAEETEEESTQEKTEETSEEAEASEETEEEKQKEEAE